MYYYKSYSRVIKRKTLRLLIALVVEKGWYDKHIGVKLAYLNSKLNEDVNTEQPECCIDENKPN